MVCEMLVVPILALVLALESFGFRFVIYPFYDFFKVTMRAILIPTMQMMYEVDTKTIIAEKGWYQGIRHVIGLRIKDTR